MADKSVVETISELWDLLRAYAAQETIEPLKQLGGYLKEGLLGGFLMLGGVSFLTMGVLRGVQRFDFAQFGIGSAVPYLAAMAVPILAITLAVLRIMRTARTQMPHGGELRLPSLDLDGDLR